MKAIDTWSIQEVGIPSMVLMERAALTVAEEIEKRIQPQAGLILSLCGTGNNGADGLAAARILSIKGFRTAAVYAGRTDHATTEWITQKGILDKMGIPCLSWQEFTGFAEEADAAQSAADTEKPAASENPFKKAAVVIDALFGIGLTREVRGDYAAIIGLLNQSKVYVASVDIASGVFAGTGQIGGTAVRADLTVTFGRKKVGQILYPGADYCGELICRDIGFAPEAYERAGFAAAGWTDRDMEAYRKPRPANSHKGTFGKVLVIAGCRSMAGAAVFSARSAYRMGAGLVKIHTPYANSQTMFQMVPEAIMSFYEEPSGDVVSRVHAAGGGKEDGTDYENEYGAPHDPAAIYDTEKLREEILWADVIVFGPGIGRGPHTDLILDVLLDQCPAQGKSLVIDADGLRTLAAHPDWYRRLSGRMILTPHLGEMAGLTGRTVSEISRNLIGAADTFAAEHGCILVLKSARTITASPEADRKPMINTSGCSAMATAGSGDVLTGVIAGLLAEGYEPFESASMGAYIHGKAGQAAAEGKNERAVIASDIIEGLERM
ncbi:MAG: NAD(P)H-hydrate dehydratase [Lachnospiraceae bacterium]|nr:NAD(P)H-hydrate dehydratase [Lachnospiraceae bacterium]